MISVVVPVYNEADNIRRLFDEIGSKISTPCTVHVVYDHDKDTTVPVVKAVEARYPFEIALNKNRFGGGVLNAIKTGFLEAENDAVLVVMADLSDDLRMVDQMYNLLMNRGYDIVCGSRYMPGGKQVGGPFLKGLLSRTAGVSLHYLTGLPTYDVTNSFKMYRRDVVRRTCIESMGGFEIGMELVVKTFIAGGKIAEVPTTWTDRVAGQSRFRLWKWMPKYLRWYLYAFRRYFPGRGCNR
jgi:dolichol-phosphate mannosyltransferase